ncbi:F-box domain-containing protein [Mycena chlorophos]|uniref:F-box domain-containing protein n=1 Tax=Mycena chlorophos TaxID=658473 RepID=A0A8H6WJA5_MYCCL|nr:F-box domain-containing protein [Mycena chlorophos]
MSLVRERDALREHIDAHNALLAPIRRMPSGYHAPYISRMPSHNSKQRHDLPRGTTSFSGGCAAHGELSRIQAPFFWSPHSPLRLPNPNRCYIEKRSLQAVSWWLDKSGACPLSISVYCLDSAEDLFKVLRPLFSALGAYSHPIAIGSAYYLSSYRWVSTPVPLLRSFGVAEPEGESQDTLALQVHNMQNMVNNIQVMVNTVQTTVNHLFTQLQAPQSSSLLPVVSLPVVLSASCSKSGFLARNSLAFGWDNSGPEPRPLWLSHRRLFEAMDLPVNWTQLTELSGKVLGADF